MYYPKRRNAGGTPVGRRKDTGETPLNHTSHIKATETKKHRKNTTGTSDEPQGTLSHTYYHAKMEETKEGMPRYTLSHVWLVKAAITMEHQTDAGGMPRYTSDPLIVNIVPRLSGGKNGRQVRLGKQGVVSMDRQARGGSQEAAS